MRVPHRNLAGFTAAVLEREGVPAAEARTVADLLVLADLRGVGTHGVRRLASYVDFIRVGVVRAASDIRVTGSFPGGFSLDGGSSLGQVVATRAMDLAIERAGDTGIACVGVRNGGHVGAHGNIAIRAAEAGMLGLLITNGRPQLAPVGGREGAVSSTPFAIACPSGREFPLVLDMALGVAARGHILRALAEGSPIPPGWAVDRSGRPTTDAKEASLGSLLPVGGHKGYGLAVMFGVLGGVLTGAAFGADVAPQEPPDPDRPFNHGHFVLALDIRRFMPLDRFMARAEAFVAAIKATPLADGATEIVVPGERSYRTWAERRERGIALSQSVLADLRRLGAAAGVEFDAAMQAGPDDRERGTG